MRRLRCSKWPPIQDGGQPFALHFLDVGIKWKGLTSRKRETVLCHIKSKTVTVLKWRIGSLIATCLIWYQMKGIICISNPSAF